MSEAREHAENGKTYRAGMRVRRVDFENDGTPPYEGVLTRIDRDGTYWITWEGAPAPDPHGAYAFEVIAG